MLKGFFLESRRSVFSAAAARSTSPASTPSIRDGAARISFAWWLIRPGSRPPSVCLSQNLTDGWSSLCHLLAKDHGQLQLQVNSTRDAVQWPMHCIQVWYGGTPIRLVRTMRDADGWEFFQKGEVQSFEEVDLYDKRISRQRLDRVAVVRYLQRVGWDVHNRSFWESDMEATYFDETSKRPVP